MDDELMELRQLAAFEAVARHASFTRAAAELRIAQPAVSAHVRRLEAELGVTLLARTTRSVSLTPAGELLLTGTRRALGELDAVRSELDDFAAIVRGRVALGATTPLGGFDLPHALAAFSSRHPGVTIVLRSGLVARLLDQLDGGELDLVLGPIHDDLASRFAATRLADESLVLILPPDHPLTRVRRLAFADTRDEPFVCLAAASGLRTLLDAAGAAAGFTPQVRLETHSATSIRELVAAGLGVALIAASAARAPGRPVATRHPDLAVRHPPIGVIHYRDRRLSPAARACRAALLGAAG
jgi:LysR family transcriptional regulator, transcription activator of glutamate synthase operon